MHRRCNPGAHLGVFASVDKASLSDSVVDNANAVVVVSADSSECLSFRFFAVEAGTEHQCNAVLAAVVEATHEVRVLVVDDEEIAFLHVPECLLVVLVVTNTCVDACIQLSQFLDHRNLVCSAVNEASKLVDLVTSTHHEAS